MRSFRWLSLIVLLFAAGCTPPPDTRTDSLGASVGMLEGRNAAVTVAPGDTLDYKLVLTSFGNRATGALFTVTASGGGWQRPIRQATTTLTTDFKLINTTDWTTSTFKLYAWGTRSPAISKDSTLIATWTVNRSVGPPPGGIIDSSDVIALRAYLNPENLGTISPVKVVAATTDSSYTCPGEWAGARNRSLRILPTFSTDTRCLEILRTMRLNQDALFADSAAIAEPDTSIYKSPPLPWDGSVLFDQVLADPPTLREGVVPSTLTLHVGQMFRLCYEWVYGDGTMNDTCVRARRTVS